MVFTHSRKASGLPTEDEHTYEYIIYVYVCFPHHLGKAFLL